MGTDEVAERAGRALIARFDFGRPDRPIEVTTAISNCVYPASKDFGVTRANSMPGSEFLAGFVV